MKFSKRLYFLILIIILFLLVSHLSLIQSMTIDASILSADKILFKVEEKYKNFNTYKDVGLLTTGTSTIEFKTWYSRPQLLLFKHLETVRYNTIIPGQYGLFKKFSTILSNDKGTKIIDSDDESLKGDIIKKDDLRSALVSETGVTYGAAIRINSLLIEDIDIWKITNIKNPILITSDKLNDDYYEIIGTSSNKLSKFHIFIDKNNYLIRKIIEITRNGTISIDYNIVEIDNEIPKEIFYPIGLE